MFYLEVRACLLAISVQARSVKLVINDILKFKLSNFRVKFHSFALFALAITFL